MTEPLFFERPNGLTAQEIMALTGAVARLGTAPERRVSGIAALDRAGPRDLAFLQNPKYAAPFATTRAGICLTTERFAEWQQIKAQVDRHNCFSSDLGRLLAMDAVA